MPGTHEAWLINPVKGCPVKVCFTLPCGCPKVRCCKREIVFDYGLLWFKGQTVGTGQCNVKAYNRQLRDLISNGRAKPSFIVSHELPLKEAPKAYRHFDARDDGWTKVVLKPAA